jgi:preprotein translocase SecE subunit
VSFIHAITGYVHNAIAELRQVRWPTRNQAIRLSIIVIGFTLVTALAYGVVDFILGRGMAALLQFA